MSQPIQVAQIILLSSPIRCCHPSNKIEYSKNRRECNRIEKQEDITEGDGIEQTGLVYNRCCNKMEEVRGDEVMKQY